MAKIAAFDIYEFGRFVLTGVTATIANLVAVWLARQVVPLEIALLAGLAAGLTLSFILSKWFAFDSRAWNRATSEAPRFLIVYAVGCVSYWVVAMVGARYAIAHGFAAETADLAGALVGASTMTFTSYFGHRFFTYRTHRRATGAS
jgi:putative flippase GtrA